MTEQESLDKSHFFNQLLTTSSVYVSFFTFFTGVFIPEFYHNEPILVLQYGHQLAYPIPDLTTTHEGIFATLLFNSKTYLTKVPWKSVFMLSDGDNLHRFYPPSNPKAIELLQELSLVPEITNQSLPIVTTDPPSAKRSNHLKLIR